MPIVAIVPMSSSLEPSGSASFTRSPTMNGQFSTAIILFLVFDKAILVIASPDAIAADVAVLPCTNGA